MTTTNLEQLKRTRITGRQFTSDAGVLFSTHIMPDGYVRIDRASHTSSAYLLIAPEVATAMARFILSGGYESLEQA